MASNLLGVQCGHGSAAPRRGKRGSLQSRVRAGAALPGDFPQAGGKKSAGGGPGNLALATNPSALATAFGGFCGSNKSTGVHESESRGGLAGGHTARKGRGIEK